MLFAELPPREAPWGPFYDPPIGSPANDGRGKEVVSFYLLNCLRKYGNLESWRDHVIKRFQTVGFNTAGNWSDELIMAQREVPHTRALQTKRGTALVGSMPDVFDPEWAPTIDQHFAEVITSQRDNPWLIGYFVDNEMGWGGIAKHPLHLPETSPCRQEFLRFCADFFDQDLQTASQRCGLNDNARDWQHFATALIDCPSESRR